MDNGLKIFKWIFLYPMSLIYRFIVGIRNILFDAKIIKSENYSFPLISLGNLNVGGSGKTPHVEYIAELLKDNYKIAVLSRGYKRATKGFYIANANDKSTKIGDEPLQIKLKNPEITVAVDENRRRGIQKLFEKEKYNALILDDAFQHRKVNPGLNILLTSFNKPFTKDHFLPLGRLREHPNEQRRAHIIIVTKCPDNLTPLEERIMRKELKIYPFQFLFFTRFEYSDLKNVFDSEKVIKQNELKEKKYHITGVSAIANNKLFSEKLAEFTDDLKMFKFMDHHYYSIDNIQRIKRNFDKIKANNKLIITTEKDAVKIRELDIPEELKNYIYYIPIKVSFIGKNKKQEFNKQINHYVATNKRYSKLYKGQDQFKS